MNPSLTQRALSLSFAVIVTLMTLAGVDALATQQPSAALTAQVAASQRV